MSIENHPYRQAALNEAWRLASLIDRNPFSRTRGSFSRTHWGWKFEDFPFPRMQEGVYALCKLHDMQCEENPFHGSADVARWIEWGFEYWISLQHPDGAFDEAYPNERCLAATAFTAFYLGSAYLLWRERLPKALQDRLETAFAKAGGWLCNNDETHGILSNHLAVAVAALEILARICKREEFSARARFFLDRIFFHQSKEGWMKEYDGADIGYGTHGFFYLAEYWRLTQCPNTYEALTRFAEFLAYFVHPDGTIGGEYSSRNTEFFYSAGFEILAGHCSHSRAVAMAMRGSIASRRVCGVWAMDSFNFMPMLNNLLFANDAAREWGSAESLPWKRPPFSIYFDQSGLWIINREKFYAIVGLSKGGTVSVFDKEKQRIAARHAGHYLTWKGRIYASQDYSLNPPAVWGADRNEVTLNVPWKSVSRTAFTPLMFLCFRMFTLTLGRFPAVSRWVKRLLVAVLINRKKHPPVMHSRTIRVAGDGIVLEDQIDLPDSVTNLTVAAQFTAVHMGSSMYCDARAPQGSSEMQEIATEGCRKLSLTGYLSLADNRWLRRVA